MNLKEMLPVKERPGLDLHVLECNALDELYDLTEKLFSARPLSLTKKMSKLENNLLKEENKLAYQEFVIALAKEAFEINLVPINPREADFLFKASFIWLSTNE